MRNYLTQSEINSVVERLPVPYTIMVKLMVWTGRRPTEVLLVKPMDIDHEHKMIEFIQLKKRQLIRKEAIIEGKKQIITLSKRKKVTKPIDISGVYDTLYRYLDGTPMNTYIFPSPVNAGKHISLRSFEKKVKKAGEEVNLDVHPHMFRHSFAVQYLEKRINNDEADHIQALVELKNILGHSSLDTTMGYLAYVTGQESLKGMWD